MKAKIALRIAAVLMLLHDLGHTMGALTWKKTPDPAKQEVIRQMTDKKFPFMGKESSLAEYMDGYGIASTLAMLLIVIVLWIISGADNQTKAMAQKITLVIAVILALWAIDELIFFFPFAALFTVLAAIFCFYSYFKFTRS